MGRSRIALLLAAVSGIAIAAVVWVVVGRGSDAPPGPPAADVYAGVAAALSRPGMVAHVTFDSGEADAWISSRREAWLDVAGDVARTRTTTTYRSPSVSTTRESGVIYRAGAAYTIAEDGKPNRSAFEGCPEVDARVLMLVVNCPRAPGTTSTRTESGRRFDGVDALAVVIEGKLSGIDSVVEIHNRLFVDAGSYLPLAFEDQGTDRYALGGYENDFQRITRYTIDFVTRDSLTPDFFEPSAIGFPPD